MGLNSPYNTGVTNPNKTKLVVVPDLDRCYNQYRDDPKGHPEAFFANAMRAASIVSQLQ